ncbi:hypothetical protein CHISP_2909 [Chitinispirillum alkaliphilum]|nr:hypothetical protein CHISP_2909 [Chitinispirillum alkaliphilum]
MTDAITRAQAWFSCAGVGTGNSLLAVQYYHPILSPHTITPYYHPILSPHTITPYYHPILSPHTITPYYHPILSPHTITPYYLIRAVMGRPVFTLLE